jgi:hypothetical protein
MISEKCRTFARDYTDTVLSVFYLKIIDQY